MRLELCHATTAERSRLLSGDELIPSPAKSITHAITIAAPAEAVWPWLVQLGAGRAGWYSYDRIDNGGVPSARKIVPELQHVAVGDILPATPGRRDAFIVQQVRPREALVLVVPTQTASEDPERERRIAGPLRVSWALVLETCDAGTVRLISRGHISRHWLAPQDRGAAAPKRPLFIDRVYGLLAVLPWNVMLPFALAGHYAAVHSTAATVGQFIEVK